ncbi:hypothetical protein TSOC_009618 [Tetrabaena socialis]|uniref:Cupin type-2 domain-containing protein n=1 Tax=Tetrabaena socialis TaxID=47790 RepID=A0A2J7ZVG9_9CHLO|nr:hypothetical protein TSOC_009618 [Tetrabaena socialis]|eukprot:PNH04250.1 hypothetical protein TSOC_009618 [Tetrabaena socialis]
MLALLAWATVLAALVQNACAASVEAPRGLKCRTKPPPYIQHTSTAWNFTDEGRWGAYFFGGIRQNGPGTPETGRMVIGPGTGFNAHRHLASGEWIFVLVGTLRYGYWDPSQPGPTIVDLGPGAVAHIPMGQIHQEMNEGTEVVELLVVSNSFAPMEFYEDWPETADTPGYRPPLLPWEQVCPPGSEELPHEDL